LRRTAIPVPGSVPLQIGIEAIGPVGYLILLFLYSVATTIILPIPVEFLLPLFPEINAFVKAAALGLGKGVGAIAVFYVGYKVNPWIERWTNRHGIARKILNPFEWFVRKTGWIGLLILLAIPLMPDTAVDYFYSLLNAEGRAISRTMFVLANVAGGFARAIIVLGLLPLLFPPGG